MPKDDVHHYTAPVNRFGGDILCARDGYVVDYWYPQPGESPEKFWSEAAMRIGVLVGCGYLRAMRTQSGDILLYRSARHRSEIWLWGVVQ